MVTRHEFTHYLDTFLQVNQFDDYAPNGLQVEGNENIKKIITGVTANQALIERAVQLQADVVLVHHGFFWKNEDVRIVGMKKKRIQRLLQNNINLFAYHLPLDAHPVLGNNVQLGNILGLPITGRFGQYGLLAYADLLKPMTAQAVAGLLAEKLNRAPLMVGNQEKIIQKMAWCTGAAQGYLQAAIDDGVDAYISGEISEQTTHIANENDVVYFAAGHHATERYGIQALGQHLAAHFNLQHVFVEIENPV